MPAPWNIDWSPIKLLLLDSDGVLTDGGVYIDEEGREIRRFDIKDGAGLKKLQKAGIRIAVISSSPARPVLHRAEKLGIAEAYVGVKDKIEQADAVRRRYHLEWNQVAYMGDDLADVPLLQKVGLPIAVADAIPLVCNLSRFVTDRPGGHGAVREVCNYIIPDEVEIESRGHPVPSH